MEKDVQWEIGAVMGQIQERALNVAAARVGYIGHFLDKEIFIRVVAPFQLPIIISKKVTWAVERNDSQVHIKDVFKNTLFYGEACVYVSMDAWVKVKSDVVAE
jgi:hypothetical protein